MAGLKDLPTATWLKFFDELGKIGIMDASLTGGEALLRPDIFELIDGIIANRMRYNLLSNGTLIDEKLLKKFEHGKKTPAPRLYSGIHRRLHCRHSRPEPPGLLRQSDPRA